jgi:DNA-binding NarL/FixJ family response regulator
VIRIVIVDDHPAVRMGLEAALEDEPGFVCVGAAEAEADLMPLLRRVDPDVVLLDYQLPGNDGLHVCRRIKAAEQPPRVLILSAFASDDLALSALLAGADGVLAKAARAKDLRRAVRRAAAGEPVPWPLHPEAVQAAASRVDPEDLPVLGMLLDGTRPHDIESVLHIDHRSYLQRVDRLIARITRVPPGGRPA